MNRDTVNVDELVKLVQQQGEAEELLCLIYASIKDRLIDTLVPNLLRNMRMIGTTPLYEKPEPEALIALEGLVRESMPIVEGAKVADEVRAQARKTKKAELRAATDRNVTELTVEESTGKTCVWIKKGKPCGKRAKCLKYGRPYCSVCRYRNITPGEPLVAKEKSQAVKQTTLSHFLTK